METSLAPRQAQTWKGTNPSWQSSKWQNVDESLETFRKEQNDAFQRCEFQGTSTSFHCSPKITSLQVGFAIIKTLPKSIQHSNASLAQLLFNDISPSQLSTIP
jgi:hypothetical protein